MIENEMEWNWLFYLICGRGIDGWQLFAGFELIKILNYLKNFLGFEPSKASIKNKKHDLIKFVLQITLDDSNGNLGCILMSNHTHSHSI